MGSPTVAITGAAGGIGRALWRALTDTWQVRLFDRVPVPDAAGAALAAVGDVTDPGALAPLLDGADAIVHLAGNRRPVATWEDLTEPNLTGVRTVLTEAARHGVRRVVLASSCHASGQDDLEHASPVDPGRPARPCCPYGVTKAFAETAGRYAADRLGLDVVALRFGAVTERPTGRIVARLWLSLPDMITVVRCALTAPVHYGVYYAASANAAEQWDLGPGERDLGYVPRDDARQLPYFSDLPADAPACFVDAFPADAARTA